MITDALYKKYLTLLLSGKRQECARIVQQLLDQGVDIQKLYTDLFQKSLYEVGGMWELHQISVAREHLVTAITEGIMNQVYPRLFENQTADSRNEKKVIISCAANEFHQIGGRMVADIFELNGWNSQFLGANTPVDQLLVHIQEESPDLVGLSASASLNMQILKKSIEAIRSEFKNLDILVGGQAFTTKEIHMIKPYGAIHYVHSLDELQTQIAK
jgi:methanogenic corrinoid protein MtbC1